MSAAELHVYQEVVLVALRGDRATLSGPMPMIGGAAGALADLMLLGRCNSPSSDRDVLVVLDPTATGDPVLDRVLSTLGAGGKPRDLTYWVPHLARTEFSPRALGQTLTEEGLLEADTERWLGLFSRTVYAEDRNGPGEAVVARLRMAIAGDGVDRRTDLLLGVVASTHLLKGVIDSKEIRNSKKTIRMITDRESLIGATKKAADSSSSM